MKKRVLIIAGSVAALFLVSFVLFLVGGRDQQVAPGPSPSLLPETAVKQTKVSDLKFEIEYTTVSPTGKLLFATHRGTALATANADGSEMTLLTPQRFSSLSGVAWSADTSRAVLKDFDGTTYLFNTASRDVLPLNKKINNVAWAPDNLRFIYTFEGKPQLYDIRTGKFEALGDTPMGNAFTWSPDSSHLAAFERGSEGGKLTIVEVASKTVIPADQDNVVSAHWLADGKTMVLTKAEDSKPRSYHYSLERKELVPLGAPADITDATTLNPETALVTGPAEVSASYFEDSSQAKDSLWQIRGTETKELTQFDRQVRTVKIIGDKLFVITNTRVYEIELSNG